MVRRHPLHRLRHVPRALARHLRPRRRLLGRRPPAGRRRRHRRTGCVAGRPGLPDVVDRHRRPPPPAGPALPVRARARPRRARRGVLRRELVRGVGVVRHPPRGQPPDRLPPLPTRWHGRSRRWAASPTCCSPTATTSPTPTATPSASVPGSGSTPTTDRPPLRHDLEGAAGEPTAIAPGVVAHPVPGHTRGSVVFLVDEKVCFSGDSLAWSQERDDLIAFRGATWFSWKAQTDSLRPSPRGRRSNGSSPATGPGPTSRPPRCTIASTP